MKIKKINFLILFILTSILILAVLEKIPSIYGVMGYGTSLVLLLLVTLLPKKEISEKLESVDDSIESDTMEMIDTAPELKASNQEVDRLLKVIDEKQAEIESLLDALPSSASITSSGEGDWAALFKENSFLAEIYKGFLTAILEDISEEEEKVSFDFQQVFQLFYDIGKVIKVYQKLLSGDKTEESSSLTQVIEEVKAHYERTSSNISRMEEVGDTTMEMVNKVASSIKEVQDYVSNITTLASQSNMLALNSAIEAARAGEAGKGFAVVAGEMRLMADKTRIHAENISKKADIATEITNSIIEHTNTGMMATIEDSKQIKSSQAKTVDSLDIVFKNSAEFAEKNRTFIDRINAVVQDMFTVLQGRDIITQQIVHVTQIIEMSEASRKNKLSSKSSLIDNAVIEKQSILTEIESFVTVDSERKVLDDLGFTKDLSLSKEPSIESKTSELLGDDLDDDILLF